MRIRRILVTTLLAFSATAAHSQSVSPVLVQGVGPTFKNQIEIRNASLLPMVVTLEPMSFDDGPRNYRPLDSGISVKLSETSFRMAPKSSHKVFYEARCQQTPCWFTIFSSMSGVPQKKSSGLASVQGSVMVSLHLPQVAYILSKTPPKKSEVSLTWEANTLRVENRSSELTRLLSIEEHYQDGKKINQPASLPLFPASAPGHVKEFPLADRPAYVIIHFSGFDLDSRKD